MFLPESWPQGFAVRFRPALAAIIAGTCIGACGDSNRPNTSSPSPGAPVGAKSGGTLHVLYNGDVDSIDPGVTYYSGGYIVTAATQRSVLRFAPEDPQHPVPGLAAALPAISRDGKTVTVRIRSGVKFSPPVNREVTAQDVKYAIERGLFRTVNNGYVATYFGDVAGAKAGAAPGTRIAGIQTPGRYTIVFKLLRPTGGALAGALTLPLSAPVPREYAARHDRKNPSSYGQNQVATGPYMIANTAKGAAVGYRPGRSINLVRNPNWDARTDERPAYVDEVVIDEGNSDTTLAARKVLGGHHRVSGDFTAPAPVIAEARERTPGQITLLPIGGIEYIPLNTAIEPFDDVNVRRAVVAGFDRNAIRLAMGGASRGPLATHFIPPQIPGFEHAGGLKGPGFDFLAHPSGDARLAAKYFRQAGHASGRYDGQTTLFVASVNDAATERAAQVAQRNFERLGFKVRLRVMSPDTFFTKFCTSPRAKVHACVGWGWFRDFSDGQTILGPTFSGHAIQAQNNSNVSQLDIPQINDAIRHAETLIAPEERARAWAAVDRAVTAQAPAIPGSWINQAIVRSKDVAAVANASIAGWDLTYTSLR